MEHQFTIKVFFRGDWCPWCNAYLRDFNDKAFDEVTALGGRIVGITSQVGNRSRENNSLRFEVVEDPSNAEAERYDIFITPKDGTPLRDVDGAYEHGMAQPGVVIEDRNGTVLYRWAIDPNEMNLGGASDRPLVTDIVENLKQILAGGSVGPLGKTDMSYLETQHPAQFKIVQDYIASLKG